MAEQPISGQHLRTPVSYERWLLQYRDGLDLDNPYHDTEFDTEDEHLEHAEYMLFEA